MRILCIDQFSGMGGGQRSLLDLLPAFAHRSWEARVLLPDSGPLSSALHDLGVDTDLLNCGPYSSLRKPVKQVLRYASDLPRVSVAVDRFARRHRSTLLYVNGPRYLPAAAWIASMRRIPLVFHCHSRLVQSSAITLAGTSLYLSKARVIACCQHAVRPLKRYIRSKNLSIIYNGIAPPLDRPIELPSRLRRIGVLGRIEPEKGQIDFVRAARLIANRFPDCTFHIAGAPVFSGSEYYDRVVRESVNLPVRFEGWQTDIGRTLSSFDVLVVPSTNLEATTRVILEAYSIGLPVVAFPSGGIPEILTNNETGFLARSGTPESLAERIISVLQMPRVELEVITSSAKAAWHARYNLSQFQRLVCNVLERAEYV